jgi:GNAT superfamily N-acetyltransferase
MPPAQIRPFVRTDRDQLASLVNAHIAAVLPGASLSVQALLSDLESEPGEFIVDRWVSERRTFVAEQRHRIVAAAHLLRYRGTEDVDLHLRDAGEIKWLLCWPDAPYWPDAQLAGRRLMAGCLAQLSSWRVTQRYADGSLPVPGAFGLPDAWPHIRALYAEAGFTGGRRETVLVRPMPDARAVAGPTGWAEATAWTIERRVGTNGVRFVAVRDGQDLGYLEVDTNLGTNTRFDRDTRWADIGNLYVEPEQRRRGVATALLAEATNWLALAGIRNLLAYVSPDTPESEQAFLAHAGFVVLSQVTRGLTLPDRSPGAGASE